MGKIGPKFSHLLTVRAEGPRVSLPVKRLFFDNFPKVISDWTDPLWRKDAGEATVRAGERQGRTGWNDRIIMEMQQIILLRFCKTYCKFVSNFFKIFYLNTRNLWYKFLARITEQRKDDYDNDVSDNCDHNFGTFDDFGVKNDQKVSNNMTLMSKYKGKHGGKKGQKIRARPSPPPFRAMPFSGGLPLLNTDKDLWIDQLSCKG